MQIKRSLLAAAGLLAVLAQGAQAADALPTTFKIDESATSVSGLSSGAFMAVQLQVAYSGSIAGAGVIAGGPYGCAQTESAIGGMNVMTCMGLNIMATPKVDPMLSAAQGFAKAGEIDPLENLGQRRVYVFSGKMDSVVRQKAVDVTVDFFKKAGVPAANLEYVNTKLAGHAVITKNFGGSCAVSLPPYINGCEYDGAGALLKHIYGPLQPKAEKLTGRMVKFDQRAFAPVSTSMASDAYVYVPKACDDGESCKVHVAIHGCGQSYDTLGIGDKFINRTGYNEWADTNKMLVLYPQVDSSLAHFSMSNVAGCWDWMGYTGKDFAKKSAPQMKAIMSMVKALGSGTAAATAN